MIKMKRCNIFINGFRTIIFCKKVTQGDLLCCLVLLLLFLINLFFCFGHAGLHCQAQAFSSWSEWGTLFVVFKSLLMAVAPLVKHRLQGSWASVIMAHGPSCSMACRIFLDQGSNWYPLHLQLDSYHCTSREIQHLLLLNNTKVYYQNLLGRFIVGTYLRKWESTDINCFILPWKIFLGKCQLSSSVCAEELMP